MPVLHVLEVGCHTKSDDLIPSKSGSTISISAERKYLPAIGRATTCRSRLLDALG